ncbi:hypothetical protein BV25DRAFT_1571655 [Artomyces pyxidatus]|uniref:Uncharacterized protein n=1 Tax=Artomyces pyxidatus TaxID=48021 RepID=A0ACB8SL63_9AGAM|nr:hypothetical protein BV25DRAFT_1571655 [Artomyces pyxidatus]
MFPRPTPNLKTFKLSTSFGPRSSPPDTVADIPAPPTFVGNCAPKLKTFYLAGFTFCMDSIPVTGLTRLHLALPSGSTPQVTFESLLDYLEASPTIQDLYLAYCFPPQVAGSLSLATDRIVPLPNLKSLTLQGAIGDVAELYKHVESPATSKLHIECTNPNASSSVNFWDSTFTFPGSFDSTIHIQNPFICSLVISRAPPSGMSNDHGSKVCGYRLELRGYRCSHIFGTVPWSEQLGLRFRDANKIYDYDITMVLHVPATHNSRLHNIWSPLIQIDALAVRVPDSEECWNMTEGDWRDIFRQSQFVQHMEISGIEKSLEANVVSFLRALVVEEADGRGSSQEGKYTILPSLKSFGFNHQHRIMFQFREIGEGICTLLLSVLRARTFDAGVRLPFLSIESYDWDPERPGIFDGIADEVCWVNSPTFDELCSTLHTLEPLTPTELYIRRS